MDSTKIVLDNSGDGNYSGIDFERERSGGQTGYPGGSIFMLSDTSSNNAIMYLQAQSASAQSPVTTALSADNGVRLKLQGGAGIATIGNVVVGGATTDLVVNGDARVTGNVSVGGTLTYEDVTNIDSVGLITARSGIKFGVAGAGGTIRANGDTTLAGVVTASSFVGDLTGTATSITVTANNSGSGPVYPVFVSGSATGSKGAETDTNFYYNPNSNELTLGSIGANYLTATLDINANGNIIGDNATNISGINSVTATAFFGDGSNLTGISAGGFSPDDQENLVAGTGAGA